MSKPINTSQPWAAAHAPSAPHAAARAGSAPTPLPSAPVLSAAQRSELQAAFDATLRAGMHGLCFSPYLDGQGPGSTISEAQIRERMRIVAPHTRWVRSFSCTDGNSTSRASHTNSA